MSFGETGLSCVTIESVSPSIPIAIFAMYPMTQ